MTLPGPSGLTWAVELVAFAAAFVPAGELFRRLSSRWVSLFRDLGWIERVLLDLYLGGGVLYVLAAVPLGLFDGPLLILYLGGAAAVLVLLLVREWRSTHPRLFDGFRRHADLVPGFLVVAATAAVFGIEVFVAEGVPTGNSYDTSLLTDYVALLLLHHQLPVSLAPIVPQLTSYPQGTTVWLAAAQLLGSLPPARTPLLVTPLFLSMSPLAGYVLGRRQLGSRWAGALIGLTFALIGSWTRVEVATSNDFVFSFPLVLWLLARSDLWRAARPPAWPDTLAYGAVLGYSAALNPVGAEWLFPMIVVLGLLVGGFHTGYLRAAVPRWIVALVVGLLFVTPALWTILQGGGTLFATSGGVVIPASSGNPAFSTAQLVGSIDPFLFRAHDIWLSPFWSLRIELAAMLVAGAAILLLPNLFRRIGRRGTAFRQMVGTMIGATIAILLLELGAAEGVPALHWVGLVTSEAELSIYLFVIYTILAALPLYLLAEFAREQSGTGGTDPAVPPESSTRRDRYPLSPQVSSRTIAVALVVALLIPGLVVTGADLPPYLQQLYGGYGRVTPGDFALFDWAGGGLPTGARVLVAPGSAAQFLPGYANIALIFPVQNIAQNTSYVDLDRQLVGGNLTPSGFTELAELDVQYIAVTGNTTDLWAPFSPAPLLADPAAFPLLFQSGDAYVFQVRG